MEWRVAEAKNRFSELLDKADEEGVQRIRRRGQVYEVRPIECCDERKTGQALLEVWDRIGGAPEVADAIEQRPASHLRDPFA